MTAPGLDEAAIAEVLRRTWVLLPRHGRLLASVELDPGWFPAFAAAIAARLADQQTAQAQALARVEALPRNWNSIRDGVLSPGLRLAAQSLRAAIEGQP